MMSSLNEPIIDGKENLRAMEFLSNIANVKVAFEEEMPDQICYGCLKQIRRIHAFIAKCQKTDVVLTRFKETRDDLTKLKELEIFSIHSDSYQDGTEIKEVVIDQHPVLGTTPNGKYIDESLSEYPETILVTPDFYPEQLPDAVIKGEGFISEITSVASLNHSQLDTFTTLKRKRSDIEEPLICSICSETFNFKKHLKQHMKTAHSTIDQTVECDICHKVYKNKMCLRKHKLLLHTDEFIARSIDTAVQCPICFKFFDNFTSFTSHYQSHREFVCEYCSKTFRRASELVTHQESSQRGEFKCELCSKVLERESCLEAHMQSHEEKEEAECKVCFKGCENKLALQIHMQVIHGIDPYRCKICLKKFRTKMMLTEHIRCMHSENVYYVDAFDSLFNINANQQYLDMTRLVF
ncbi:unnamed protein product [Hermetia illucens]|uniref:C2H2-type domain-containing protein n=2 Tax=Hermetia illucens TaxID=343691 RepID=A0A7R8YR78_HERIL|nr:unnamed protein product [Hermetia illucens]